MKLWKKSIAVLAILCMICTAFQTTQVYAKDKDYFAEVEHDKVSYSKMSKRLPDTAWFTKLNDKILSMITKEEDVREIYGKLVELSDILSDAVYTGRILQNDMNLDGNDKEASDKYAECVNAIMEMETLFCKTAVTIRESKIKDDLYKIASEDVQKYIEEAEIPTEEQIKLQNDLIALQTEYRQKASLGATIEINGTPVTAQDLMAMYTQGMIGQEDYMLYSNEINKKFNEDVAEIYLNIVKTTNNIAKSYDYDNYYDYAAENIFSRTVTGEEIESFRTGVKECFPTLLQDAMMLYQYEIPENLNMDIIAMMNSYDIDMPMVLNSIGEYMKQMSPELSEAYQYMQDMQLIDFKNDQKRVPSTYTTIIGKNKPYMQNGNMLPLVNMIDTLLHEFGHYNVFYHFGDEDGVGNYDLLEIHSTSLEFLAFPFYDQFYGDHALLAENIAMYNTVNNIIVGCLIDELETYIYKEGITSISDVNRKYAELAKEYGMANQADPREEMYEWTSISHMFLSPGYFISYALSGITALEIYIDSEIDYDKALDAYLTLCSYGVNGYEEDFLKTLEKAGIDNITESENILDLSEEMYEILDISERITVATARIMQMQEEQQQEGEVTESSVMNLYAVKTGDTLSKIAVDHKVTVEEIVTINSIENPNLIYEGTILVLPETAAMTTISYTIDSDDTLCSIARELETRVEILAYLNAIEDIAIIHTGDVLVYAY